MEKIKKLNQYLSDLNIFYRKLQNYHWYVKGANFFQIHEKLEEYYNEINEQIDEVAELILQIGANPLATLKDYLAVGKIKEAKNEKVVSKTALAFVKEDFEYLLKLVVQIKELADKENDSFTSAKMDAFIENYTKHIWMLRQQSE